MAISKMVSLGCVVFLLAAMVVATPPGTADHPAQASCKIKKYKMCYNVVQDCPQSCPAGCEVECASCKPMCTSGSSSSSGNTEASPLVRSLLDKSGGDDNSSGGDDKDGGKKGGDDDSDGKGKGGGKEGGDDDKGGKKGGDDDKGGKKGGDDDDSNGKGKGEGKKGGGDDDSDGKGKGGDDDSNGKGKGDGKKGGNDDDSDGKGKGNGKKDGDGDDSDGKGKGGGKKEGDSPTDGSGSTPPYIHVDPSPPLPVTPPTYSPPALLSPPPPSTPSPSTPSYSPPPVVPSPTIPTVSPSAPTPPTPALPSPVTPTPSTPPSSPYPTPSAPLSPSPPIPSTPSSPSPVTPSPSTPTTPPSSDVAARKRVRCKRNDYKSCYGQEFTCPANCPTSCQVDCNSCKPVCSCDYPGAVCQDPRFIGGDGLTFYFHGKKDRDFCLVTDPNLHINAHFIGKRSPTMTRDFTWVQSLGILFNNHRLYIGALKTGTWDPNNDRLSLSLDDTFISLPETPDFEWRSSTTPQVTVTRISNANNVVIQVQEKLTVTVNVVPITKQESRVHNYDIREDDCFAHLDVGFKFYSLSKEVDGVLGKTYRDDYVSKVNMGVAMPVMGGNKEYSTSDLFATDCLVSRFNNGPEEENLLERFDELASMNCASGMDGEGVVCKR